MTLQALALHPRFRRLERMSWSYEQARGAGAIYRITWLLPSGVETRCEGQVDEVIRAVAEALQRDDEWERRRQGGRL